MDRTELDQLDRAELIARAEALNIPRARILTRPELVDEILTTFARAGTSPSFKGSRGFFGRARDLLARVVERGLHLPDAAERIRLGVTEAPATRTPPAAMPTVTLAEIYVAQGHRDRAIETLANVLAMEPEHAAARALLARLEAKPDPGGAMATAASAQDDRDAAPTTARRRGEESAAEPPAPALAVALEGDACVAVRTGPASLFVYWHVRPETLEHVTGGRPAAQLTIRVLLVEPSWEGPRSSVRDLEVGASSGDVLLLELPAAAVARVAVGIWGGPAFVSIAHSPLLELASDTAWPAPVSSLVRWTRQGVQPVRSEDPDASAIAIALARARKRSIEPPDTATARARDVRPKRRPSV